MKNIIVGSLVVLVLMAIGCANDSGEAEVKDSQEQEVAAAVEEEKPDSLTYFGERIDEAGAMTIAEFKSTMIEQDTAVVKVEGTINSVCQKKGCWVRMDLEDGNEMLVRFKDYGFFLPKDCSGQNAVLQGMAYTDTITVAQRKHYAEDAGKSEEEIEAINEPEIKLAFLASGVKLK